MKSSHFALWGTALCCLVISAPVVAEEKVSADEKVVAATWPPLPPFDSHWDWIQLTSGEWLKGTLRSMELKKVNFDSDKLNTLSLDWDDISAVYTAQPMAVMDRNNSILVGRLHSVDGRLSIEGSDARLQSDDVISIARSVTREVDRWFGNIAAGLDFRDGNVDQKDLNFDVNLQRRTAKSSMRLNYVGNYSEFDSEENSNDHRASIAYDYRLTRDWFLRPLFAEYYRDPFQNIDQRLTLGFGGGYFIRDKSDLTWTVSAGPAYQETRYVETPADSPSTAYTPAFFMGTNYDQEVTSDIDVIFSYQLVLTDEASGRAAHHAMVALDVDLTDSLDLRVSSYWDRLDKPQADADGVVPQPDDFRIVVGLNLEL